MCSCMQWLSEMSAKAEPLLGRFKLIKGSLIVGAQGCVRLAEVCELDIGSSQKVRIHSSACMFTCTTFQFTCTCPFTLISATGNRSFASIFLFFMILLPFFVEVGCT